MCCARVASQRNQKRCLLCHCCPVNTSVQLTPSRGPPAAQLMPQAPLVQVGAALARAGHTAPQSPQLPTVLSRVSQPLAALPSQSLNPGSAVPGRRQLAQLQACRVTTRQQDIYVALSTGQLAPELPPALASCATPTCNTADATSTARTGGSSVGLCWAHDAAVAAVADGVHCGFTAVGGVAITVLETCKAACKL